MHIIFCCSQSWPLKQCHVFLAFTGPINISTTAVLVSPGISVHGTMSITTSEVYFEVDEDHEDFKKIDPQVGQRVFSRIIRLAAGVHFVNVGEVFKLNEVSTSLPLPHE